MSQSFTLRSGRRSFEWRNQVILTGETLKFILLSILSILFFQFNRLRVFVVNFLYRRQKTSLLFKSQYSRSCEWIELLYIFRRNISNQCNSGEILVKNSSKLIKMHRIWFCECSDLSVPFWLKLTLIGRRCATYVYL